MMRNRVVTYVGAIAALYHILNVGGVFIRLGFSIPLQVHRAASLTVVLFLIFLIYDVRGGKRTGGVPWYDYVLIAISVFSVGFIVAQYDTVMEWGESGRGTALTVVLALLSLIVVLEATRRCIGLSLSVVAGFFFIYTLYCNYFPGIMHGRGYPLTRVSDMLYSSMSGIFGIPLGVGATVIFCFLAFSQFLSLTGASETFIRLPLALFGRVRGGPAKVAVVASGAMGMLSGSILANVTGTGIFTIPLMKKVGYRPDIAGAVEAAASTGGQFMPPVMGGVIFLMVEWLNITYLDACWAAWLPATLYFFSIFMTVDFEAGRTGLKGLPRHLLPPIGETLKKGWWHFTPLFLLIYFLAVSMLDAEKAVLYSLVGLLVINLFFKEGRMGPRKLLEALDQTFRSYLLVGISCAAAGVIVGSLTLTGVGVKLAGGLLSLSGGSLPIILLLAAGSAFILGMGMISLPIYVILAVLVVPALVQMGVPELAAHFFIFVCGLLSFVTPPVALAAYAAASIAGASPMRTGVQATRMAIGIFLLPFWFIYRPALLMMGTPAEIVFSAVGAIVALVAIAAGITGYALRPINGVERVLVMIGAVMLIVPDFWTDVAGLSIIGLVALHQFVSARKFQRQERIDGKAEDSANDQMPSSQIR